MYDLGRLGNSISGELQERAIEMAYPNLRQACWVLALLILMEVVMGIFIDVVQLISGESLEHNNYAMGLLVFGIFLLILSYISRRTDRRWVSLLHPTNANSDWQMWPCVAISITGTAMVLFELNKAVISVVPMPESVQELTKSTLGSGTSYPSALFHAAVVAPYVEELLFRGVILSGLLSNNTRNYAIVWSSILFSVSHLNPWQLSPALLYGFVFAWWTIRTGSLWPALLGHGLNNFLSTTFMRFEFPYFAVSEDLNDVVFNPWWWSASGVALAALGLWWFSRVSKPGQSGSKGQVLSADARTDDR